MIAGQEILLRFLEGSDKRFLIPVYQRNYDWSIKQCKQLFNDLENIIENNLSSHFFGATVHQSKDNSKTREYMIIDGQQRLTTVSLLLLAIYTIIDDNVRSGENINIQKIYDEYLVDKYAPSDTKIKLKPVNNDFSAYEKLFKKDDLIINSNITTNFNYFYEMLKTTKYELSLIYSAIEKLNIVIISLEEKDDAQLIFESLNSTGLDLTEADKVRNFILMKHDIKTQERYYYDYWNKIEKNSCGDVSSFLRHYLTIKNNRIPNKKDVYMQFKQFYLEYFENIKSILEELLKYSKIYRNIILNDFQNKKINEYILDLNRLETVVSYPFVLELLIMNFDGIVSDMDCEQSLKVIRDYVVRRFICEIPTASLNKTFMTLNGDIKKHGDYKVDYFEICKFVLLKKANYQRFPDDLEYYEKFVKFDIYNKNSKNRIYILSKLENFNNKEYVDLDNLISENIVSIEHIMPQTLNNDWKKELGEDFANIHLKYLNTIGNISLTGYNSKLNNHSFSKKKSMENGYNDSKFFLNKIITKYDVWNKESIEKRADLLQEISNKIWEYPTTNYTGSIEVDIEYTLEDVDVNFSGSKICSYNLFGENKNAKFWLDFYKEVLRKIYNENDVIFNGILNNKLGNFRVEKMFSYDENKLQRPTKLIANIFIETNLTTEDKLMILRKIFEYGNIDLSELSFTIHK